MNRKHIFFYGLPLVTLPILFLCLSCAPPTNPNINSVLWVQTAAEFQASCQQAYNSARMNLETAIADPEWTAALEQTHDFHELPPAIIFDIDETVLDTSPYQGQLALKNSEFQLSQWDRWIQQQTATEIAGAVDFIRFIQSQGIAVFFISNRECRCRKPSRSPCPQKIDTLENLKKMGIAGINGKNILLKNEFSLWGSDKKSRRAYLAEKYRLLMIFGDDLGDFIPDVKQNMTPEKRKTIAAKYKTNWGSKWFILSNPMYGSWQRILEPPRQQYLKGTR